MTYAWAKWDFNDQVYHGHDYRSRRIALRYIAEYLGGEKHSECWHSECWHSALGEKSTWRTHHGKVRAEGPIGTRNVGLARYKLSEYENSVH